MLQPSSSDPRRECSQEGLQIKLAKIPVASSRSMMATPTAWRVGVCPLSFRNLNPNGDAAYARGQRRHGALTKQTPWQMAWLPKFNPDPRVWYILKGSEWVWLGMWEYRCLMVGGIVGLGATSPAGKAGLVLAPLLSFFFGWSWRIVADFGVVASAGTSSSRGDRPGAGAVGTCGSHPGSDSMLLPGGPRQVGRVGDPAGGGPCWCTVSAGAGHCTIVAGGHRGRAGGDHPSTIGPPRTAAWVSTTSAALGRRGVGS